MNTTKEREMGTEQVVKTKFRIEKDAKDLAVYTDWKELISKKGAMASAVDEYLMKKYNIHSRSTIWFIRQRVEKRLRDSGVQD